MTTPHPAPGGAPRGARVALVHALAASVGPAEAAFRAGWPEARLLHRLDASLSRDLGSAGRVDEAMVERFLAHGRAALAAGADAVLFTCSAFDAAIDRVRGELRVPVLAPTEALVDEIVAGAADPGAGGATIGGVCVLATFAPTLVSLEGVIRARGRVGGVVYRHAAGALEALDAGAGDEHDALVAQAAARAAAEGATTVALAQFSMARAAPAVERAAKLRVLTTPGAAVDRVRRLLTATPVGDASR